MYPILVFASFLTIFFAPAKLLYNLVGLVTFSMTFTDFFVDNWNAILSSFDALYMTFLSPIDAFVNLFALLPLDIAVYLSQVASWFVLNVPIMTYYTFFGLEILNGRLYWVALWIIFHFTEFKDLVAEDNSFPVVVWFYLFWPFMIIYWYGNYLWMAFGWTFWFNDVHQYDWGSDEPTVYY